MDTSGRLKRHNYRIKKKDQRKVKKHKKKNARAYSSVSTDYVKEPSHLPSPPQLFTSDGMGSFLQQDTPIIGSSTVPNTIVVPVTPTHYTVTPVKMDTIISNIGSNLGLGSWNSTLDGYSNAIKDSIVNHTFDVIANDPNVKNAAADAVKKKAASTIGEFFINNAANMGIGAVVIVSIVLIIKGVKKLLKRK